MYELLSFGFYLFLDKFMNVFHNKKIALNNTCFTHASLASIIGILNYPTLFKYHSTGFFLFDMYDLLHKKKSLGNLLYLYHHIVCIYYMRLDPNIYNWLGIITTGELSNLSTYYVYDEIQKKKESSNKAEYDNTNLMKWKTIQLVIYGIMRLPVATYLTYNEIKDYNKFKNVWPVVPLYFFGILWWYYMIKLYNK